jgi:hypothetical protein
MIPICLSATSLLQEYEYTAEEKCDTHALSIPWEILDQRTLDLVGDGIKPEAI